MEAKQGDVIVKSGADEELRDPTTRLVDEHEHEVIAMDSSDDEEHHGRDHSSVGEGDDDELRLDVTLEKKGTALSAKPVKTASFRHSLGDTARRNSGYGLTRYKTTEHEGDVFGMMNTSGFSESSQRFVVGGQTREGVTMESPYDVESERKFREMQRELYNIHSRLGGLDVTVSGFGDVANRLRNLQEAHDALVGGIGTTLEDHRLNLSALEEGINVLATRIDQIEAQLQIDTTDFDAEFASLREDIKNLVEQRQTAEAEYQAESATNTAEKDRKKQMVAGLDKEIDEHARAYLKLKMKQTLSGVDEKTPNAIAKMAHLQAQLLEVTRRHLTKPQAPVSRWSLAAWYGTDKNTQAVRSVQRLLKNKAFASPETTSDADLKVNADILKCLTAATYALTAFEANHAIPASAPAPTSAPATNTEEPVTVTATPPRSTNKATEAPAVLMTPAQQVLGDQNVINRAVLIAIREDLKNVQTRADGMIGTQNPTKQFWGKVLMALALAIAATIAAVAIMSVLGFALPTFIAPYVAYIQASQLVATVLNFVSAKLAVDLTTAAAVTAAAGAATIGLFGKDLYNSGAPTSLKKDLDRAAQDLDTAIAATPAMSPRR